MENTNSTKRLIILALSLLPLHIFAQTLYVTDQFEITMRSGASTSNNIISMLKSGQPVTLIERDEETRYSLVETPSGKKGYVLTRFLDNQASGRERYEQLKIRSESLQATIKKLQQELAQYKNEKEDDVLQISSLQNSLDVTEKALAKLQNDTRDTMRILNENEALKSSIQTLDIEKSQLAEENALLKDSTAMDWFIRGAGVSLLAFFIGILVTRIRWKKRDSWSNY